MTGRFFVDRSLGGKIVPRLLREDGWDILTMRERYHGSGDRMPDVTWITEVAVEGMAVLTCDGMILSNPVERAAILRSGARIFTLPTSQLTGPEQAARFIAHREEIQRWSDPPGPAGFVVYERRLSRVLP